MAKIIQLIRKYWNIILFLMLEIFCIRLIIRSNSIQGVDLLNSSNAVAGFFYEKQNQVVSFFQMGSVNKALVEENTRLKQELDGLKYFDTLQDVTSNVPLVVYDTIKVKNDSAALAAAGDSAQAKPTIVQDIRPFGKPRIVKYASYKYIAAKVINNSVTSDRNNYITINKGSADGIQKDMAVVTANGVVGRVAQVSKHYAVVISVLSSRPISSQVAGGNIGVSNWGGDAPDYVTMSQVDVRTAVRKGDTAYTTGYSYFPENIPVGIVTAIDTYKVNNTLNLKLKLANNFRNLHYVYVVAGQLGTEKQTLEKAVSDKEKEMQQKAKKP